MNIKNKTAKIQQYASPNTGCAYSARAYCVMCDGAKRAGFSILQLIFYRFSSKN